MPEFWWKKDLSSLFNFIGLVLLIVMSDTFFFKLKDSKLPSSVSVCILISLICPPGLNQANLFFLLLFWGDGFNRLDRLFSISSFSFWICSSLLLLSIISTFSGPIAPSSSSLFSFEESSITNDLLSSNSINIVNYRYACEYYESWLPWVFEISP